MESQVCVRCKKRPVQFFIARIEKEKKIMEGICLKCASELGVNPMDNMLKSMGMSEEEIANVSEELDGMLSSFSANLADGAGIGDAMANGHIPTMNLGEMFGGMGQQNKKKASADKGAPKEDVSKKNLNTYCTNLNKRAADGKIDRIIGRDREIERVIQILSRRQKNNPCLIGEPGVGKTAIAEELAARIVEGRVPEILRGYEIWLLDLTSLVAGTQFRGQFESRILALLKEIKAAGNVILMIDEVHNIAGAGETSDGSMSAANLLKPALSRGEIRVIGATTLKEYRKYIEKDSALERRFQPVKVDEPSVEDTVEIIKGIKQYYERFHRVIISDEVARLAAILSERYINDRFLPDKAIDVIDEAAAKKALSSIELNELKKNEKRLAEIDKLMADIEALVEKPDGQTEENYKRLADLKVERINLEKRREELSFVTDSLSLQPNDLLNVIEVWTGIPASELSFGDVGELRGLRERIGKRIVGQDEALDAVVRAVKRKRSGVSYRRSPVSMIFAGPTGVGKTELVKVLAEALFKQPEALIRLDMSEFMEKHSVSKIIGAPPGYVGYDEAGQLTEKIRRRPYSVILFDEIEKAHPDVLNILLQILDDGKITDSQGRQVNFENTIIIMTTNAGSETSNSISGFAESRAVLDKEKVNKALSSFLRPEFINRIDEIIAFRHLDKKDFIRIAGIMTDMLKEHLEDKEIALDVDEAALAFIAEKSYSEKFGARNMRRYIERNVEDKIAELLIENYGQRISNISVCVENDEIAIKKNDKKLKKDI